MQGILLAELELLAWRLRLRDGADAAMPRSLKRQLMKSGRKGSMKAVSTGGQSTSEAVDCTALSDSEAKDVADAAESGVTLALQTCESGSIGMIRQCLTLYWWCK